MNFFCFLLETIKVFFSDFKEIFLIFSVYFFISFLTSKYTKKSEDENVNKSIISSLIALLLTPLFFKSIGNDLLERILGKNYNHFDVMLFLSYATIISLAGKKVIDNILTNFNLKDIEEKLDEQSEKQENIMEIQNDIISVQVKNDLKDQDDNEKNEILSILKLISKSKRQSIELNSTNSDIIKKLETQKCINIYGSFNENNVSCSITKIGLEYIKEIENNQS